MATVRSTPPKAPVETRPIPPRRPVRRSRAPSGGRPAIVVGTGVTALGMIRSLGRAGIPALLVGPPGDIARRSRWARPFPGTERNGGDGSLAELLARSDLEGGVLIPGADSAVREIARLPGEVLARFPASVPSEATLEILIDKRAFAALMRREGMPHPRTIELDAEGELDEVEDPFFERAFLKPRDSQRFFGRFGVKGIPVRSREEAAERLRGVRAEGFSVVLQEYIPGPPTAHVFLDGFVDRHAELRLLLTRRRTRMYPRDFGNSTLCETVLPGEVAPAVAALRRLLDTVSYRGIFSAEVKFDARTEEYRFLEVNARAWWYVEFAARCGVNVCEAAYRDALGEPVEYRTGCRAGIRLLYPRHDLDAFRAIQEAPAEDPHSTWDWFRPWLGARQALFVSDDPWPAIWDAQARVARRLRRRAAGAR
jgi:D-aspartate ligase